MKYFAGFVAGWAGLLTVKYIVVGLDAWNRTLHPGRVEDPKLEARFGKPFLGAFSR